MKYGLTRVLQVYDLQEKKGEEVEFATAGDYLQAQMWCQRNLKGIDELTADLYQTFAWAWHALVRLGKAEEYGISGELSQDALDAMASRVTVYMESVPDDSLPLGSATRPRK